MNSSVLERRQYHVSALLGHCVVFFSGEADDIQPHSLRSLCMYNPYTDRCLHYEITGEMDVPRTRAHACAVNISNNVFMFGGCNPYGVEGTEDFNDVWKLAFDEDSEKQQNMRWEEIKVEPASKTPSPRCGHCGWMYNDLMWTFGGWGPTPSVLAQEGQIFLHKYGEFRDDKQGQTNQLLSFNPSIKEWINHESRGATPCPRFRAAAAVLGGSVWLYGGQDDIDHAESLNDLHQLDMDSLTWTQIQMPCNKPPRLYDHTLNRLSEQSLLLCGGPTVLAIKVVAPGTVQVSELTTSNRCSRRLDHAGTTVRGNNVVIHGGNMNGDAISTNDLFVLFSSSMTLLQLATRMLYKYLDTFTWQDIPVTVKKLLYFPVTVQGESKM